MSVASISSFDSVGLFYFYFNFLTDLSLVHIRMMTLIPRSFFIYYLMLSPNTQAHLLIKGQHQ